MSDNKIVLKETDYELKLHDLPFGQRLKWAWHLITGLPVNIKAKVRKKDE